MSDIMILHGPNLNMLGRREPEIYGATTQDDIRALCEKTAQNLGYEIDFRQTNYEGELVSFVHDAMDGYAALLINAGAYTHTSLALHDALKMLDIPVAEVHITNPKERETFRHHSYVEPVAGVHVSGKGAAGYREALEKLAELLKK